MKKLLIIGGVIVAIFALIIVLNNQSNKEKLKDNPYGTNDLSQATIDLLGNENYSNIVLPDELYEKVTSGEDVTAYFFHPECQYCQQMTPILMPIAKEKGIHVYQYNMMEFPNESQPYGITSWPALIHYKDGKEVARSVGLPQNPEEDIRTFFDAYNEQ
ncbi:thioredoxin family protein [Sporosarcina sp. ACRSL]|uniref:thioredoxin family protein n=1 Tax=Sporosarcina sp. ACRSL TaxID=2918215 RepID=UPI001EF6A23F|nr:thioredoxin family protein [Sporosarcina sp. ACRSL]MCG7345615.1 thioredoxin family protein [Sporosarcina sp. ACRSL]